jgi:hypothetical protein
MLGPSSTDRKGCCGARPAAVSPLFRDIAGYFRPDDLALPRAR